MLSVAADGVLCARCERVRQARQWNRFNPAA